MAIIISLAGNSSGDGFLIAPVTGNYDVELLLSTDSGTASVTLQASPDPAGLVFSQASLNLTTTPTAVNVHATLQSGSRGDTTIQVLEGATVVASFDVTSITHPVVNFRGRFEARFSTDNGPPNLNPIYTAGGANVVPPGWTWGLEGEPDFVPVTGIVPENLETPGMGRVIRLNNPVALRSQVPAVVSTVDSITGSTSSGFETFTAGDPLIGQPVNFGPDTYFAGNAANTTPTSPAPEEWFGPGKEPLALFELHFGSMFSGKSQVGPFVAKATAINQKTRTPDSRPIAAGIVGGAAELAEFGLPPNRQAFGDIRIDQLVAEYDMLPPGDSPNRRNLARRIGHLLGSGDSFGSSVTPAKKTAVEAHPAGFVGRRATLSGGYVSKEVYGGLNDSAGVTDGRVDAGLVFAPGGSAVVEYMSQFTAFNFEWHPFGFHSDENCGYHKGFLTHLNFDGSYAGDPHTRTVDGTRYDFQAVGEFTLLRDGDHLEIQARQTPVATQNPITDSYSGLTSCVSVNTAIAARFGPHRIALQPRPEGRRLQFYVNGKPATLPPEGINLSGHRVTPFDANGETGVRVDCEDQTTLIITPKFWNKHNVAYLNVSVSNTRATQGVMGFIPRGSWLPRLRDGSDLGPRPASLTDRYAALYRKFADSWRVTDQTSLFIYAPGTSSKTFTDLDWPAEKPPCKLKPQFQTGALVHEGMPVDKAALVCQAVTEPDLHANCVFDVVTTGDEVFAESYLLEQTLRLHGTLVQLVGHEPLGDPDRSRLPTTGDEPKCHPDRWLDVTARVAPLTEGRPIPTGCVTFFLDGVPLKESVNLDERGRGRTTIGPMEPGEHIIHAAYAGGGKSGYHPSSSRNLRHTVACGDDKPGEPLDLRVVLEKIEVLDDRDLLGKGEVWFEARVRTSLGGGTESSRRLPERGHFSVSDKPGCNVVDLGVEIFCGKASGELVVQIRGGELDWLTRDDPLGTYTRRFEGAPAKWLGRYQPDDEPLDSEDVGLWRVTYRIERA